MENYVIIWRHNEASPWRVDPIPYTSIERATTALNTHKKYDTSNREFKVMVMRELEIQ